LNYSAQGNVGTIQNWISGTTYANQSFTYYSTGLVNTATDPMQHTTTYTYNTCNNSYLTNVAEPLNLSAAMTWDCNGGVPLTSTDENLQVTTYKYGSDPFWRVTEIDYPDNGKTTTTYNDTATPPNIVQTQLITSTLTKTMQTTVDSFGRPVQTALTSDPSGTTYAARTFDSLGRVAKTYNPTRCNPPTSNCNTESTWGYNTTTYDALGRVISVVEQDGSVVSTSYTGNCATAADEAGHARESCNDALGRTIAVWEDPGSTPHLNYETDYAYDALNNLLSVTQKGGATSGSWRARSFTYDGLSRVVCAGNPEIQAVTCPSSATGPFPAGALTYAYDSNSNLLTKTAPLPNQGSASTTVTTNYTYDALNRLTKKTYMDGSTQDPYTPTVQFGYDGIALSGCTISPPGDTDPYPAGRPTSMCDGSGGTSWVHDTMGRVNHEYRAIGKTTVAHYIDSLHNLDGSLSLLQTQPLKKLNYTYNAAGQPTQLVDSTDNINFATNATYAPPGELTGLTLGSATGFAGLTVSNAYNLRLQPILLSATSPTATVSSECFDFHLGVAITAPSPCSFSASTAGNNGNVYQIVNNRDNTRNENFMYDSLNRIQQAYSSGSGAFSWGETFGPFATSPGVPPSTQGIDSWGNLTNRSGVTGKTYYEPLSCPANTNNQLTTCSLGYDAAGNMTSNGSVSYVYDAESRLVWTNALPGNPQTRYIYDGNGQRVEKCAAASATTACPTSGTTGTLYWRGTSSDTLAETDLGGNYQEEYIFFNGQRIARRDTTSTGTTIAVHYYFSDHLGSHTVVENAAGTSCDQDIDYYPYGGVEHDYCPNVAQNYKFTGKERDSESGLDNFGFRYYGSSLGRFTSADDGTDQDADNPQSWNLYSYVRNNPVKYTDPDGHDCIYIDNDSGKMTGFNRGDCDNSTEEKANSGVYVNGTVNSIELNSQDQVTGYSGTGEGFGVFTMGVIQPPGATPPPQVNDPGMIPGMLGPGDLVLFSGVKLPSVVTDAVGKLVGSILGKGVQQGVEQGAKESVQLTTHAALRLGQRGITQAAVDEAVATAKAAGQVATQMGKYGTEQIVYKGTNGITVVVETQGSNAGKAITAFQTGSKP
jgi:RHS repeat-associated protein